jgi:hypothetical protein
MFLFRKDKFKAVPPLPSWEEIVDHMHGKELEYFDNCVVDVLYSRDRSRRIVFLQSENEYYKVVYEEIRVFDEDEWVYFCNDPDRYPAWWEPVNSSINTKSFYGNKEEALKEVKYSYEYIKFFA